MYGECVEVKLDQVNAVKVFVLCSPYTSKEEKKKKVLVELRQITDRQLTGMEYVNYRPIQEEVLLMDTK